MYKEIVYYIDTNLPNNLDTRRTFFQDCQVSTKQPKPVSENRSTGLGPFSSSFHLMTTSLIPWEQLWARSWAELIVVRSWAEFVGSEEMSLARRWVGISNKFEGFNFWIEKLIIIYFINSCEGHVISGAENGTNCWAGKPRGVSGQYFNVSSLMPFASSASSVSDVTAGTKMTRVFQNRD